MLFVDQKKLEIKSAGTKTVKKCNLWAIRQVDGRFAST